MEDIIQNTDTVMESVYQKQLEEAREFENNGQFGQAEEGYRELTINYPDKFGGWWAYARLYMERQLAQEPCPPYSEIELESTMLRKAMGIADNSQKLFIKQRIAEYKEAWALKCDENRQHTRNVLKKFQSFENFAAQFDGVYESTGNTGNNSYRLLRQGKKALCFQKVAHQENGKTSILKYTYNGWNERSYRLEGVYNEVADFELYVTDFDGQKVMLACVFMEEKTIKHMLIEMRNTSIL